MVGLRTKTFGAVVALMMTGVVLAVVVLVRRLVQGNVRATTAA